MAKRAQPAPVNDDEYRLAVQRQSEVELVGQAAFDAPSGRQA